MQNVVLCLPEHRRWNERTANNPRQLDYILWGRQAWKSRAREKNSNFWQTGSSAFEIEHHLHLEAKFQVDNLIYENPGGFKIIHLRPLR